MELIDTITVDDRGNSRQVQLLAGDIAALPASEAVDALVVPALPDDYTPTRTSVLGAVERAGISVADLAQNKAVDLRQMADCWLSLPIQQPGIGFRQVLCFEPAQRGKPAERVGDLFRSLAPFALGAPPMSQIAIPLSAAGQPADGEDVLLEALADAAVHWLRAGLPMNRIKIVAREPADLQSLRQAFTRVKERHAKAAAASLQLEPRFDLFVSYCHRNRREVGDLCRDMQRKRTGLRVFLDRLELRAATWQQHISMAIEQSRKVLCVFSPDYLASKACLEEFNLALLRHRATAGGVLLPVYLYSAELPIYMDMLEHEDLREGDRMKIARATERVLSHL